MTSRRKEGHDEIQVVQRHKEKLRPMKDQAERIERNALHQPIAQNRRSSEPEAENRKGFVQVRLFPQTCPQREGYAGNTRIPAARSR